MDLTEISDRMEIEQLMVRYIEAIDSKDWNLLDSVFTHDAFLDYESSGGPSGKGEYPTIKSWLQKNLAIFSNLAILLFWTPPRKILQSSAILQSCFLDPPQKAHNQCGRPCLLPLRLRFPRSNYNVIKLTICVGGRAYTL